MRFIILNAYDNYVDAHIIKGKLEEDGVHCWLCDENTVTLNPILTNAIGGIKIMVAETQAETALALIRQYKAEKQRLNPCPQCSSKNIELISTPRKPGNWFSVLIGFWLTSYAPPVERVYHCFNCSHEFEQIDEQ